MKIALYVHCFFPNHYHGTETYTLTLAQNLNLLGHDVVVVSAIPVGEKRAAELISCYEYKGIAVYCIDKNHVPHHTLGESYYQPQLLQIHANLLERIRPDIIHVTHLGNHTAVLLDAAKALKIPAVATFTDFFAICLNGKLEAANGSLCAGPNAKRTNCYVCITKAGLQKKYPNISRYTLSGLVRLIQLKMSLINWIYGLPLLRRSRKGQFIKDIEMRPELLCNLYAYYGAAIAPTRFLKSAYKKNGITVPTIHEITFGVDLDRKPKDAPSSEFPMRFGFIGQIAPHKGTSLLVEAFCRLPLGTSELHIFGAEDQFPGYTRAMKQRSAEFPVFFRGTFPSERMRQVLDELDFLVIPSTWYENSPLVLLNALASHTPVIVSNVEGLTEFLETGKNCYIFKRGSARDLERVMKYILANSQRSRKMTQTTHYPKTTLAMTKEVVEIYNSAVQKNLHRL